MNIINKFKTAARLKELQEKFTSDEFILLFSETTLLGYSFSEMGDKSYTKLVDILNKSLVYISKSDLKESLIVSDGYLVPLGIDTIKVHTLSGKPIGLTYYTENTATKMYLYENSKKVSIQKSSVNRVRELNVVSRNLGLT